MNRREAVLAMLGACEGSRFSPAQLQKALFLIAKNAGETLDSARVFDFTPYDYGPFDKSVYDAADALAQEHLAAIEKSSGGYRTYGATPEGASEGRRLLADLAPNQRDYFIEVSNWVRSMSFASLVKSIYQAYPETRANSIFVG